MPDSLETAPLPAATSRQALARSHRPRRFSEIALQDHVSATLKGAVARGRVAHGYLFSGPRGVGKTSAARILAMALNCLNRSEDGEPCGKCDSCERIWAGKTSLDVVEIDAATNRGVDDARDLRERAMYAPTDERRFKVYIIDEAHMLTREAWNALLKILEEPPPRVVFVFATTEPQKIMQAAPPVLSRCQRFDFRRITTAGIVARLRHVLEAEGIEAGDDALVPIARRAEGGMRDALSLLDQVLALADRRLTGDDVRRVLGIVGEELYLEIFRVLSERRYADVFAFVQRLVDEGYDLTEFHRGLVDALRTLLLLKLDGPQAADIREDLRPAFVDVAAVFDSADLLRMLAQTAELDADGRFRKSGNSRVTLELLLLRFAYQDHTVALEDVVRALGGASGRAAVEAPGAAKARSGTGTSAGELGSQRGSSGASGAAADSARTTRTSPGAARPLPEFLAASQTAPARTPETPREFPVSPPVPSRSVDSSAVAGDEDAGGDAAAVAGRTAGGVESAFRSMVEDGRAVPAGLKMFLRAATVREPEPGRVLIELPRGPALEKLSAGSPARAALQQALAERLGRDLELEVRAPTATPGAAEAPTRLTPERLRADRLARLRQEPGIGPLINEWDLELLD